MKRMVTIISLLGMSLIGFIGGLLFDEFKGLSREERLEGIGAVVFTVCIIFVVGLLER